MLKQMFLARFEPLVTHFGPWKIRTCFENAAVWDRQWVKNGSKTHFSKSDSRLFAMLKQLFLAHFPVVVMRFRPWTIPKYQEMGRFLGEKLVKSASTSCLPTRHLAPFAVHKQVNSADFDPVLTHFIALFRHMYAPSCTLRTHLRAILWSHLELGSEV